MTAKDIRIGHDKDNDVLNVLKTTADPKKVTNVQINADIVLRMIKKTKEVVGFIIDDFSVECPEWKNFSAYQLMEEFDQIMKILNDKPARELTRQASEAAYS